MERRASTERDDLKTLALAVVVLPLVWLVALDWDSSKSIGTQDHVAQGVPFVRDLLSYAHGDFRQFAYRVELLGGAKMHDVFGTPPFFELAGWLGIGPLPALNGILFFTQVACAFFGVRLAYDLAQMFSGERVAVRWLPCFGIVLLSAFSPLLAWKITVGHHELVFGSLLSVTLLSMLLAERNRSTSFTLLSMTLLVQLHGFQSKGQQLVYGVLFFGLALLAAAWPLRPVRRLLVPALLTAAALALSLPKLAGMLSHAVSSDAGRTLGGDSVIYSYVTATLHDWVASVPWGFGLIALERDSSFWHEVNFGFGPPLLLALLLPWNKERLFSIGLAVSFVGPLLFSMDVPGVAWTLTHLCPPVQAFRVPERAMMIVGLLLPAFAGARLLMHTSSEAAGPPKPWALPAVALAGGMTAYLAPPGVQEALAWGVPVALVAGKLFGSSPLTPLPAGTLLVLLGCCSLSAFKERLRPYANEASLFERPAKLRAQMQSVQPELLSPLSRIVVHFDVDGFQTNTAYAMGVSSLSGYLNPPRRFLALDAALSGEPPNPLRNYFRFDETSPSFTVLAPLYNVKFGAFPEGAKLRLSPVGQTAGPAWFSASLTRVETMTDLARELHAVEATLAAEAHRQAWVVASDEAVLAAGLPAVVDEACARAQVTKTEAAFGSQTVKITVEAPASASCPLTIAMNFAVDLAATADGAPAPIFPAFGALTGVWVPAGAHEVVVRAEPIVPLWSRLGFLGGVGLLGLALFETARARRRRPDHAAAG